MVKLTTTETIEGWLKKENYKKGDRIWTRYCYIFILLPFSDITMRVEGLMSQFAQKNPKATTKVIYLNNENIFRLAM